MGVAPAANAFQGMRPTMGGSAKMEVGTNRSGGDYTNRDLPDAQACQTACTNDVQCKSWTWVKPGVQGPAAKCWLKNVVPPATRDDCCSSGMK